ncbi:S-methyl-5-thioribose-1-phosphate isomerase [Thiorhodospira sibirica]|uniref:S-methyl-5-thioribose-1-phosphate isomerase n=1 Tax=Thiorhodospira sibirica TaxID=154347 RepID=UPI00022C5DB4|nr:S-methyl-5-thioribose-1-phosphate isomerase [Thiorhodospira sibirica]
MNPLDAKQPSYDSVRAVQWLDAKLRLLDQRVLPHTVSYLDIDSASDTAAAIRDMVVRGAPAIGITAAYGVVLAVRQALTHDPQNWQTRLQADIETLAASRPTAVNLFWALKHMQSCIAQLPAGTDPVNALLAEAQRLHQEDIAANQRMGELGAAFLQQGGKDCALTHCNSGALATGGYGTGLGVIRSAYAKGYIRHVFADETRPWLQGSRLTAWELVEEGIPVSVICEGAAASLMREGRIGWVVVGADRIAANGDTANKVGTYGLAIMARHHGLRFMVVAPTATIDMQAADGRAIPIEQRDASEVLGLGGKTIAANGAQAWNPSFDVTPAELIDVIVTERGVVEKPTTAAMAQLMAGQ